jgi:hypothetical protein
MAANLQKHMHGRAFPRIIYRPLHSTSNEGPKHTSQVVKKNLTHAQ